MPATDQNEVLDPEVELDEHPAPSQSQHSYLRVQQVRSGPLPSPVEFEHYEHILPGAADRILSMAEEQMRQRHKNEEQELLINKNHQEAQAKISLQTLSNERYVRTLGAWVCAADLALAALLGWNGHKEIALALLGIPVLTTIGIIISSHLQK